MTAISAQTEEENSNVELPDFVITGTDILSIQSGKKIQPDFVSTLSEETLKPVYSPEQLEMKELPNPVKNEIGLFDSLNYYAGSLKAGVGFYTLPVAELRYAVPFAGGIFDGYAGGKNIRSYEPNSGRYYGSAGLNLKLFTPGESSFLPGAQFLFHGDYGTSSFKFYGGPHPTEKREINNGNFSFDFNSLSGPVTGGIKFQDEYNLLKGEDFNEHYFASDAFLKGKISSVIITLNGGYNRQMMNTDSLDEKHSIFYIRPAVGISFSKTLETSFGLNYSKSGGNSYTALYASMKLMLDKYFSVYGEYSPSAEIYSAGYFLSQNRFFNIDGFTYIYSESVNLNGVLKYEYDKYFEIHGGIRYRSSDAIPYFKTSADGKFDAGTADGHILTLFGDFLFHQGPYGRFYGTVEFNNTKDSSGGHIPYMPAVAANLSYGYDFGFIDLYSTLYYSTSVYTDIPNDEKMNRYFNLSAGIDLKLEENFSLFFELNNLLNRNNFIWKGYKEPPLDLVGGLTFRW